MDHLINLQFDIQSSIKKSNINYRKSPKERITLAYVESRLETLEEYWICFKENHKDILSQNSTIVKESDYVTNDVYEATEESYTYYKSDLKNELYKLESPKPQSSSHNSATSATSVKESVNIQLPKISIPTFSGLYSEWCSFRDLFTSLVHNNTSIDDVQKLHYLKSNLSGEAEQLLRHIPITGSNYEVCWTQLIKRYNNKRYLVNNILKRFFGQKIISVETSKAIKDLLDTTNECLNALRNLEIDISSWDILVIYIISSKLDVSTRKQWEQFSAVDELPTLNTFTSFLEQKFRSLEFLDQQLPRHVAKDCKASYQQQSKSFHAAATAPNLVCIMCKDNHHLHSCKSFSKLDIDSRRNFAQRNGLCYNCLGTSHSVYSCRQTARCRNCKKKHHSLLCKPIPKVTDKDNQSSVTRVVENSSRQDEPHVVSCFSNINSQVLLPTALVNARARSGLTITLRCLLDQASQASFVTESAVQMLGLKKVSKPSLISGLGSDKSSALTSRSMVSLKLQSLLDPEFVVEVKAHVLKKLTTLLPSRKVVVELLNELSDIKLADPSFNQPNKIDVLLGGDIFGTLLLEGLINGPSGSPMFQNTKLGWIVSGVVNEESSCNSNLVVSMHTQLLDNDLLKKFWELESDNFSFVNKKHLTEEEQKCEEFYSATTTRDSSGRYIVRLPFRTDTPECRFGNSRIIAAKRLNYLEKRLARNSNLQHQYSDVISEYLELGHMEPVPQDQLYNIDAVYLPHHAVIREDKVTTKVRVVFDAACPGTNGVSLNNCLMVGPTLQSDLRHILMRWRLYPIAIISDMEKMYRQVIVSSKDTDYQRILWRDKSGIQQHYRLLRVTFGTASAPYLAIRTVHQLVHDEGHNFPLAADKALHCLYVDDLMTGCYSVKEGMALAIYEEMNKLMSRGGFKFQKWASSSKEFMCRMREESKNCGDEKIEIKSDDVCKVLGITWDINLDELEYTVKLPPLGTPVTKRAVIADIARLYDPLGWISPVIIQGKIFIQKLWMAGLDWDQELPSQLLQEWMSYRNDLDLLYQFRLPRWINSGQDDTCVELHGFSDASSEAYAAVVYMRCIDSDGKVHVNLITSKTKVAPIKQVSIPRLELCGAVLVAKLLREVSQVLKISSPSIHAWTDSTVVLAWLSGHPSKWTTFIANRVSEILTITDRSQWSHVRSKQNPADCASRGAKASELDTQLWKQGPSWLSNANIIYSPQGHYETSIEEKAKRVCFASTVLNVEELFDRFSTFRRLVRVLSHCKRFIKLVRNKIVLSFPRWLTCEELKDTTNMCIKHCQLKHFELELEALQGSGSVHKKSKLYSFNPFVDDVGILRVGGRLGRAPIHENMKHPILLPSKSHLTNLIIGDAHERTLHGGPQLMLAYLRSKYLILNVNNIVKLYVRKCVVCVRYAARRKDGPLMGQLPPSRATMNKCFNQSGVDYAGPISVRTTKGRGHHATKGYICLFICMATRAIHLEIASDMTTQGFLAAFKRFVARRGHCADLWSDNGTNFVGAARELKSLFFVEKSSMMREIADILATNGTNWHFIPPRSPHFGGLWESGVKSCKHHLRRVIGESTLTFEELTTVLSQIEACLNSRPMTQGSSNVGGDGFPLTPAHFLVGEPLVLVPDNNYSASKLSSLKRWQLSQRMVQDFWRRWSREYLTQFHHRYKWREHTPEPKIGDVVLIMEDDLPPGKWLYGLITEKRPGKDDVTRVVSLRCRGHILKRPVAKLIVLPLE